VACATGETIVSDLRFIIKYTPTRIFIYYLFNILTVRETDEACSFCARRSHRVCWSAWHLDGTHVIIIYNLSVICVFFVFPYAHTHTCIYTHAYTHTLTLTPTLTRTYACTHTKHTHTHTRTYKCMCVHPHALQSTLLSRLVCDCWYICILVYMYIRVHTYIYIYVCF